MAIPSKYKSPEEFIRAELLTNRGSQNICSKNDLAALLAEIDSSVDTTGLSKTELVDRLIDQMGSRFYKLFPVGISSYSWQERFEITNKQVKQLAAAGYISVTAQKTFRKFGKELTAPLYDPYAFYAMTKEQIHEILNQLEEAKK